LARAKGHNFFPVRRPERVKVLLQIDGLDGSASAGGFLVGCRHRELRSGLDAYIEEKMERSHIPGLAAAVIEQGEVAWSKGYGWADIERRITMSPDSLQNIGSISKTFVATAVMQLKEKGALQLGDDVGKYLEFPVRNPNHRNAAITFVDLMTHRSSIADGSAYARGYGCGDSPTSLEEWITGYFVSGGVFYDADENFHTWAPGERREYNNVAFGLLAYLVETISGTSFDEYCQEQIFTPLGMSETSWFLQNIDTTRHAIPYSYVSGARADRHLSLTDTPPTACTIIRIFLMAFCEPVSISWQNIYSPTLIGGHSGKPASFPKHRFAKC
jgi:CubicO group peptidase (beta-lactamase class C family)